MAAPHTIGVVTMHEPAFSYVACSDLDTFTQAYVEALFFTDAGPDDELHGLSFEDLAPETLARIIADCATFRDGMASAVGAHFPQRPLWPTGDKRYSRAGHDFWLNRNGHGAGFWDGDWPEPYATALDAAARAAGSVETCRGDDGLIHLI